MKKEFENLTVRMLIHESPDAVILWPPDIFHVNIQKIAIRSAVKPHFSSHYINNKQVPDPIMDPRALITNNSTF